MKIHPTAHLGEQVSIGHNAIVGRSCIIENGVRIGNNCTIADHVILRCGTILEDEVYIDSFSVIGGNPQMMGFPFDLSIQSGVRIGSKTQIREYVTINRASKAESFTEIGASCMFMANAHVGHDCVVGNDVILTNGVLLGGHVQVGNFVNIGGNSAVHQWVHIGESAMIGGMIRVTQHVPPFALVGVKESPAISGINVIGLKRRDLDNTILSDIKLCYHAVFDSQVRNVVRNAQEAYEQHLAKTTQGKQFLNFFQLDDFKKRGFTPYYRRK